jgi:hypothetical protein
VSKPTLLQQANQAAIDSVKADKPSQFTVGGVWDGDKLTGGVTFDRKWTNGWGLTGYLKAWYDDKPIVPTEKTGVVVGFEGTRRF